MDALTRRQFDSAMFAKDRTLAIRVGDYASRDIKEASFEYGYIKGDTYKPGGTCAGSGKITFTSIITTFNKLDILHPEIGLLVGNTYQWVKMGEYFINDIEIDRNRNTTTLELMDGMFKLNREYVTDLHFPAEVREVIQEICLKTGIELANDYFGISAMRYHVEKVPEGKKLSFRDMLSAMTQMIGMSCFFNREGKMEIRDLTESNITINADSYFLHGLTKSEIEYQIAGITCKTDKKSLTVGMKTGRSLELDNVFMTQGALNDLYYKLKNLTYYPYNLNYQGHLLLEVGQWVTIQTNKKETFKVPVLSQSFTFKGGLRGRISADSKAGNDTQYSYEGTITKQIKQQDGIEAKIQAQIEAADAAFEAEFEKRKKAIDDAIELAKAEAEEVKQGISSEIDKKFQSFDNASIQEARRKAEEALRSAGASSSLAQEAKRIGLDSIAKLEAFKSQTTTTQTALSGDLDALKLAVTSEVNQASEHRRTTTEALSRMTGQMNGFATKSEVKQDIDGLTQTFAKMRVGGRNLIRNYDWNGLLPLWPNGTDWKFERIADETAKSGYVLKATCTKAGDGGFHKAFFDLRANEFQGKDMTWSWDMKSSRPITFYDMGFEAGGLKKNVLISTDWERITNTFKVAFEQYYSCVFYAKGWQVGDVVYIRDPQLEEGTIATTPRPAPEDGKDEILAARTEFKKTADGLSAKMSAVETYISNDGQRQEELKRYARTESASQVSAVREQISRDYVGKNIFQESVQGVERRLESLSLGTSGNLLKNSNDGFYNQHDKRYRLVETLQANQTYTLVTKYWHGENAAGHTFLDGIGNWRRLTYNKAIDAWMVQFTPTQEIPAGTEITLSSDPYESKGNMHWATLVRGAIPLVHWQPAKGDVEEGVTQKLAEYKETVDGRFATISSQINGKVNQNDFQRVKETSQLYERIIGSNENDISNKVARMALTNQLFQVEVGKYASQGGPNLIKNSGNPQDNKDWGYWEIGQTPKLNVASHSFFYNEKRKLFSLTNNTKIEVPASTIRFSLKRNTNYTVALTAFNTWNMKGATIFFLGRKSGENQAFTRVVTLVENVKFSSDEAVRKNYTFNSGECDEGFIRIDNNGTNDNQEAILLFGDVDVYEGTTIRPWQPSPEDTNEAVRTVQTQLAGSWAVQNINSAGDIISGINLGATGHNRITGKLTHITGDTLIDNAVIKSAMVDKLKTANFEAGSVTTTILDAEAVTADKVRFDDAFIKKMIANEAFIEQLTSKRIFSTKVESVITSSTVLEGYKGWIGGFQLGTHDSGYGRWITGRNHFSVGMGDGEGGDNASALWVNWGGNWNEPGYYAWFVKNNGRMYCKNTAEFWKTPIIHGDLNVTGRIFYDGGAWIYSGEYEKIGRSSKDYFYLEKASGARDWFPAWNDTSDRRLKSNIQESSVSGIDIINRLKTYSYRKEFNNEVEDISCGIMAQDVQKYAPDAFREGPDGVYTYNTFALVPYLIKAIQELNQKINLMEEKYGSII